MTRKFFMFSYWSGNYTSTENWDVLCDVTSDTESFFGVI